MAKTNTIYTKKYDSDVAVNGTSSNDKFVIEAGRDTTVYANSGGVDTIYLNSYYSDMARLNNANEKFTYDADGRDLIVTRKYIKFEPATEDELDLYDNPKKLILAGYVYLGDGWYNTSQATDFITLKNYFGANGDVDSSIKTLQYSAGSINLYDEIINLNIASSVAGWTPDSKGVVTGTKIRDEIELNVDDAEFTGLEKITVNAGNGNDAVYVENLIQDEYSSYNEDIDKKVVVNGGDGDDTITVVRGKDVEINGGDGDDVVIVGNTPNTMVFPPSEAVLSSKINTGKGTNEVHVVSSDISTETYITPTKGEKLTVFYEATRVTGSYGPIDDIASIDESDFKIGRRGNDIIVSREYTPSYYENPVTDTIIIKDVVTKYDAESLDVVVGYSWGAMEPYSADSIEKYFTFDLIKGTVYNERSESYEDFKYYTFDDADIKTKSGSRTLAASGHNDEINLSEYGKNKGVTINAGAGDDTITGTKYADIINTGAGNNTIDGGAGNDTIKLGTGNNTILFTEGSGRDVVYNSTFDGTILEFVAKPDPAADPEPEEIVISDLDDLTFVKNGYNLQVKLSNADYVTLNNYFKTDALDNIRVGDELFSINEYLSEDAGYDVNGENKNNFLQSTGNVTGDAFFNNHITGDKKVNKINGANNLTAVDIIEGGKGNDTLSGGKGTNYIVFGKGDGKDTVLLSSGEKLNIIYKGEAGAELTEEDFTFKGSGKDLIITRKGTSDSITLRNFANKAPDEVNFTVYKKGESAESAYESAFALDLKGKVYELAGTAKNPAKGVGAALTGSYLDEKITGTDYKDTLKAVGGVDTLIGGKGNDSLYAGAGTTTFIFDTESGKDTVYNVKASDVLQLNIGDTYYDDFVDTLTAKKSGNNAIVSYDDNSITIANFSKLKDSQDIKIKLVDTVGPGHEYNVYVRDLLNPTPQNLGQAITMFTAECKPCADYTVADAQNTDVASLVAAYTNDTNFAQ